MTIIPCLIRRLPLALLLALAPPCLAQEKEDEVRARATWRPQAPELRELPGVEREREEFRVERPTSDLPGFQRPAPSLAEPTEAAPDADAPEPTRAAPEPTEPVARDPEPPDGDDALQETRVRSPQRPVAVEVATAAERTAPVPRPGSVTQPDYPREALRRGLEGHVALEFTVTPEGRISDVTVTDAKPGGVFENEVLTTILDWRFEPAMENGEPVAQRVRHRFEFSLDQ